jgi:tryptophan synthase beta chain
MNNKTTFNGTGIPRFYYNILPDLPFPPDPPLHPGTRQPISPTKWPPFSHATD